MTLYRVRYKGVRTTGSETVMFDVQIDYSNDDGVTWDPLEGGSTSFGVPASEVLAITRDEGLTDQQKLAALNAMLQARIRALGLTDSRDAAAEMEALLPNGWPITAAL